MALVSHTLDSYAFKSDDLYRQLLFCLNNFAAPLTELFTWVRAYVSTSANAQLFLIV